MSMWYNKTQQYLRQTFTRSGLGTLLMGKKTTDNTLEVGQMDASGNLNVNIAGSGTGGLATAANQAIEISGLASILAAISASQSSATESTSASYTLTTSLAAIGSAPCKSITLINLSTSATIEMQVNGGSSIYLEAGYSATFPASNLSKVQAKSVAGGEVLGILYAN